ncbi:hypothetical protein SEMRO_354_G124770.1 [Seminavis robusta]|uniref:Uncharacterized protein n=1 Tax=Seminavis robusta TaxID=568900 RepID=A0A9N8DT89_9STRA|nr:hypothetical protein SEMRO_354_G124770.1 [Seminavis robusta]|eukprot:Sro354_g124770.1 n/a (253) ;mRNA; f:31653-32411
MTSRNNKENDGGINWAAIMQSDWDHDIKLIEQFQNDAVVPDVALSQKHAVAVKKEEEEESEEEFEFGEKEPAVQGGKKPQTPSDHGFKVVRLTDLVPDGFPVYPNGSPIFPRGDDSPVYPNGPDYKQFNEYAAADPKIRRTNSPHKPKALDYKKEKPEPLQSRTCGYCYQAPCFMIQDMVGNSLMMTGDMMKDEGYTNNDIRKALYKEASCMIHGRLGPGKRIKLPVCVEGEIKDCYPRNKTDPEYVGFKAN